jgi:hypothetical protein
MEAFAVPFLLFVGALVASVFVDASGSSACPGGRSGVSGSAPSARCWPAWGSSNSPDGHLDYPNAAGLERGSRQLADGVGKGTCEALQHPVVRRDVVGD